MLLKKMYRILVEQQSDLRTNYINKFNFLKIFLAARASAFYLETIKNSFIGAGLILLNLNRILS
jgi:hypothetical protein